MLTDQITPTCAGCREPHNGKYGLNATREPYCYGCCATINRKQMIEDGRITLYLIQDAPSGVHHTAYWYATNWPGSLRFQITMRHKGRHNIARTRYDVWFRGPDNKQWHGVQYGENTQLLHCKRVK